MPVHINRDSSGCYAPSQRCRIYLIRNLVNGKVYVGSTINYYNRTGRHKEDLVRGKHHSKHLQRSYDKYGYENFEFVVIQYCNSENRATSEQFWIDYYDSHNNGYNIAPRANSPSTKEPWNKGLTKETDPRVLKNIISRQNNLYRHSKKTRVLIGQKTKERMTNEMKDRIRQGVLKTIKSKRECQ